MDMDMNDSWDIFVGLMDMNDSWDIFVA